MKTYLPQIIILVVLSCPAFSQIKISGKITEKATGEELIGASVFFKNDPTHGVTTDINGNYTLALTSDAAFAGDSLLVTYLGYKTYSKFISAVSSSQVLNIQLTPAERTLNAVVVTEKRLIAEEFTIRQVDQLEVYLTPTAQADPILAVNVLPSSTNTDESAALNFRGAGPEQSGLFVNEVPVYDYQKFNQLNGVGSRSILDNSMTKEELIYASNPPIEYGNVSSGLVAYTTEEKVKEKIAATVSLASLSLAGGLFRKEKTSLKFFSNYQTYPVWKFFNKTAFRDIQKFNVEDGGIQFYTRPSRSSVLKFYTYAINEVYQYYFRTPSFSAASDYQNIRILTILNYKKAFGSKLVSSLNGGYSTGNNKFLFGNTDVKESRKYTYASADVVYTANGWSNRAGVTYEQRSFTANGYAPEFFYARSPGNPVILLDSLLRKSIPEFFSYSKLQFINRLIMGFGFRRNLLNNGTNRYASSQFNVRYDLSKQQNIKFSMGTYHRFAPPTSALYANNLYKSDQLALDYSFSSLKSTFTASLFKNKLRNVDADYINTIYGGEVYLRSALHRKITSSIGYTYVNNKYSSKTASFRDSPSLNFFIKSTSDIRINNNYSIGLSVLYRDGILYTPVNNSFADINGFYQPIYGDKNGKRLPKYFRTDLSVNRIIGTGNNRRIVLFFQIQNIFNTKNVSNVNYNSDYSDAFNEYYQKRNYYFGVQFALL